MKKTADKKRILLKGATVIAALLFLLAVTLVNVFVPFRTMRAAYALPDRSGGELRIYFLDVGQGDCSVVQFADGSALVIDAGDGSWENDNKLHAFFRGLNATSYTFVATHADVDHCGGMAELIRTFGAQMIYLPAIGSGTARYVDLLAAAEESGAVLKTAKRYSVIEAGAAYASFLSPYSQGETEENDASSVLYLRYGAFSALFTGDISSSRERQLRMEYEIDQTLFDSGEFTVRLEEIDVLKVAHHGSSASSSEGWLELIKPAVAVISCGEGNPYGHPSAAALSRLQAVGAQLYRTDELGDLMLSVLPGGAYSISPLS